jgi:hypothetical protein
VDLATLSGWLIALKNVAVDIFASSSTPPSVGLLVIFHTNFECLA